MYWNARCWPGISSQGQTPRVRSNVGSRLSYAVKIVSSSICNKVHLYMNGSSNPVG